MCQCEKALISLLQREREREGVWWSAVCTCLYCCVHSNQLVSVCVKVCHHFVQLENLLFTTTKQCCLFFFLAVLQFALLLVLLVHFLHMFTHTYAHILAQSFLYALCVCV